jgi:hypothetical protein
MHLIPINTETDNDFIGNTLTVASTAAAVGKPVSIGQAWLSKSLASEWNVLGDDVIRARNPFSFWAPLDASFLQTLQALGKYTQMAYVAPDLPIYFFAYQTYGGTGANGGAANCTCTTASCSDYEIMQTENSLAFTAESLAQFTTTAFSYYDQLVAPPDTTPPAAPRQPDWHRRRQRGEHIMERFQRQRWHSGLQRVSLHSAIGRPTLYGRLARQ